MDLKLKDKVAIVTGGASGIGRSVAKMMVAEGAKVVIADIQEEKGNDVVAELKGAGGVAVFVKTNTSVKEEVQQLVDTAVKTFGQPDILFNIAGPGATGGQLDTEENEILRQFNGHLKGCMLCTQAVLPLMVERKYGKIVNIGSFAAHGIIDDIPAYCAAFGAVDAYTKNVGRWAAPHNININSVSPGNVLSPLTAQWLSEGDRLKSVGETIPIRRVAATEDVAAVCVFLASDMARHIVATDINVSGGQRI